MTSHKVLFDPSFFQKRPLKRFAAPSREPSFISEHPNKRRSLHQKLTLRNASVFERLSNELLHEIFTRLDDPQTFLALALVNRQFKSIIETPYTRTTFAKNWFATNCDDVRAPSEIEYIVRYVRRHCLPPFGCRPCKSRKLGYVLVNRSAIFMRSPNSKLHSSDIGKLSFRTPWLLKDRKPGEMIVVIPIYGLRFPLSEKWVGAYFTRIATQMYGPQTDNTLNSKALEELKNPTPLAELRLEVEDVVFGCYLKKAWNQGKRQDNINGYVLPTIPVTGIGVDGLHYIIPALSSREPGVSFSNWKSDRELYRGGCLCDLFGSYAMDDGVHFDWERFIQEMSGGKFEGWKICHILLESFFLRCVIVLSFTLYSSIGGLWSIDSYHIQFKKLFKLFLCSVLVVCFAIRFRDTGNHELHYLSIQLW